jgi:hypothetical protein
MADTDERIEAFLQDALSLQGRPSAELREGVRIYIAGCEQMFADLETGERKKDEAARRFRALCCKRVQEEIDRCKGTRAENLWLLVLEVLVGSARFPLKQ